MECLTLRTINVGFILCRHFPCSPQEATHETVTPRNTLYALQIVLSLHERQHLFVTRNLLSDLLINPAELFPPASLCHRRAGWDAAFSSWLRRAKPPEQPGKAAATTKAEGWLAIANAAGAQH